MLICDVLDIKLFCIYIRHVGKIEKIERAILIVGLLFLPLVFSPGILSAFETPKLLLTAIFLSLVLLICSVKIAVRGSLSLKLTNLDLPVILLALAYLASGIIKTPNKTEAFFIPGTASVIILGTLLFFLANAFFTEHRKSLAATLFLSAVLASSCSLIFASGIFTKIPQLPAFLKDLGFSTFGGKLPEVIFILTVLPLGIAVLLKEKQSVKKLFWGVCLGVVGLNTVLSVYKMLPGKVMAPALPPFRTSWSIAIDTLKETPLLGMGPGNYISAFNLFKPLTYNNTSLWSTKFNTSRSFLLTNFTETGLLGFAVLVFVLFQIYKMFKKILRKDSTKSLLEIGIFTSLGLSVISLIVFPLYLTGIFLFFIILSLASEKRDLNINLKMVGSSPAVASKLPAIIIAAAAIIAIMVVNYFGIRFTLAEYRFTQALNAVANNDGGLAYDAITKAIKQNPKVDRYHAAFSQIDIAIANSIAQKKDLSDQERTTVTQLIQEAISEAKAAVSLNPQRAGGWENLAMIYKSIMAFAQGADNFAVQAYNQAVALDPINPNLRITLGGTYYALGRYDEAIETFKLAVLAKPDLANAHYNLAAAYREKGEIEKAITEINTVLTLVKADTPDYDLAKSELDSLEKNRPSSAPSTSLRTTEEQGNLTPPTEAPEQIIKPPLELPEEATPPATP